MFKKYLFALLMGAAFFSTASQATVECGPAEVTMIMGDSNAIYINISTSGWLSTKTIGRYGFATTKAYLAIVQQAFDSGMSVTLGFEDGYDCATNDWGTLPEFVKISAPQV